MIKACYIMFLICSFLVIGCSPFNQSVLKQSGRIQNEEDILYSEAPVVSTTLQLDAATRNVLRSYGPTIKHYSSRYGFDWRLMLAVIKAESSFRDSAESPRGAEGLMQVMPHTQKELARQLAIEDITHPKHNIRAGIYYMRKLYHMFDGIDESDRIRFTIAAYNAGPGRVFEAQKIAKYLSDDPTEWQSVKDALPLLSDRFSTLHQSVWTKRKPKAFNNFRETIAHVEKVMNYYDEYRLLLN